MIQMIHIEGSTKPQMQRQPHSMHDLHRLCKDFECCIWKLALGVFLFNSETLLLENGRYRLYTVQKYYKYLVWTNFLHIKEYVSAVKEGKKQFLLIFNSEGICLSTITFTTSFPEFRQCSFPPVLPHYLTKTLM